MKYLKDELNDRVQQRRWFAGKLKVVPRSRSLHVGVKKQLRDSVVSLTRTVLMEVKQAIVGGEYNEE